MQISPKCFLTYVLSKAVRQKKNNVLPVNSEKIDNVRTHAQTKLAKALFRKKNLKTKLATTQSTNVSFDITHVLFYLSCLCKSVRIRVLLSESFLKRYDLVVKNNIIAAYQISEMQRGVVDRDTIVHLWLNTLKISHS